MPSANDFQSADTAISLTSNYVVLVSERLGNLQPAPPAGTNQVLNAGNFQLHFTVGTVVGVRTCVEIGIYTGAQAGSLPLYFLPWQQNAALTMTLPGGGAGPGIFMTSMLSGCSVQVFGPAASPTITHGNSRSAYFDAYGQSTAVLQQNQSLDSSQVHKLAESRANHACTGAINNMMPNPAGQAVGRIDKTDYALKVTDENMAASKARFSQSLGYTDSITKFDPVKSGERPNTGAFVYGLRDAHNAWSFYYQAAVCIDVSISRYFGTGDPKNFTMDSAVLGTTTRFFP